MAKRIISIALVFITIFSTLAITANAASYSTGPYTVTASNGVNIRNGAGSNYARVGAASKGVTFTVSRVNGDWGYTSSIKSTTGTKSGWVCLTYCKYTGKNNNSSRSTYNDVFACTKGSGCSLSEAKPYEATTFNKGTFIYVWGYLHDVNGNLYKTYGSGTCNMTLSIYRPDGSCAHTYTYNDSDNNWIGQTLDEAGTWKIQSKITGSLTGTNTRTITVKETSSPDTKYYTLTYNANGGSNAPSPKKVKSNTGFYLSSSEPTRSGFKFLGWSTSKNATSASYEPGRHVKISSNVTLYAVWRKDPTSIRINYSSCTMNNGSTKQLSATVYPTDATNKKVTWSSNNNSVVAVSSSGKLTAYKPGVAKITAKTSNGKTATCTVTVRGIEINSYLFYRFLTAGDVVYLSAKAYPSDTSKFTWTSSNKNVVSISSNGKATAKAAGTATITVKTPDGRSESMKITVNEATKWITGKFDSGYTAKNYTTVRLNQNSGNAYIYINTYDGMGKKSSGQVHVTLRDNAGNWLCEFDAKSGDKLKLGNDHVEYRVYIAKKRYPDTVIGNGDDFINRGKCQSWAINCKSNCYIA